LQQILDLQKETYKSEAELHNEFNVLPLTQTLESVNEEFDKGCFFKIVRDNEILLQAEG
jgi:hypothetical protein